MGLGLPSLFSGCRIDTGEAWVCPTVLRTLQLVAGDPTRDYEQLPVCGLPEFTRAATELAIGRESQAILENRVRILQTVGAPLSALFRSSLLYL